MYQLDQIDDKKYPRQILKINPLFCQKTKKKHYYFHENGSIGFHQSRVRNSVY